MEKPILFSTDMVKAILDGRKTMTRRVVKNKIFQQWVDVGFSNDYIKLPDNSWHKECQYQPGDTLWVRETFRESFKHAATKYEYRADPKRETDSITPFAWKPSIHMPREAARLFLTVKDVRVERLQEITEEDAMAEGATWFGYPKEEAAGADFRTCVGGFAHLWDKINAKRNGGLYAWEKNPWVWTVSFEVCKKAAGRLLDGNEYNEFPRVTP